MTDNNRPGRTTHTTSMTPELETRLRQQHEEKVTLFNDLRRKYLVEHVPGEVASKVFDKAWEDGHASGKQEVEMIFDDLADIANAAFKAGMARQERWGKNERGSMNPLLAFLVVALLTYAGLALGGRADAHEAAPKHTVTQRVWEPCEYEDSTNCVWDAKHMGNGIGRSFKVTRTGKILFISHHRAHLLLSPAYAL